MRALPRGTITFLFTDVEGSVRLWEQDADAMRTALARHDALIESIVDTRGGVVVRPRGEGDSRFAVFGRAASAVAAALDIQRQFAQEPWPTATPFRVRMALHTGEAELRAGDYYGGDVNRCARLRAVGHGSQVLLSELTARLVQGDLPPSVSLENLGQHQLRDLRVPERVFQLTHPDLPSRFPPLLGTALAGEQTPAAALPAYPFPTPRHLVGRARELDAFDQVLARGRTRGQCVFVGARAGMGKSTLLGAVVRRAHAAGVVCLAGGCYESQAVVPLRPFRDGVLDYMLGLPADRVRAELGSTALQLAEVAPELRYHLGLPDPAATPAELDQVRLFGIFHTALLCLARKAPVLVCLDDLHVADAATLDLIQFLVRQVHRLPVVVIGAYRSDEVRPGERLAQLLAVLSREGAEQMALAPLDREHTATLTATLLGDQASTGLNETLYAITEGNPFFLEQLVLALREEERIAWRGGAWHQVADTAGVVPSMVREVIQRRLDRLSPRSWQTLAMAAVLGQSVEHATLLAASQGDSDTDLLESLEATLVAQILQTTGSGYAFSHALFREVVYWGLSAPRRMLLHARAATAIEALTEGRGLDRSAELAHHFSLAGPAPAMRARALRYSLQAGRAAAALSSHREALAQFTRAVELIESGGPAVTPSTQLAALEGRAQAQRNLGRWRACVSSFEQVLEHTNDPVHRAQAQGAIGRALAQLGDIKRALAAYADGLGELASSRAPQAESVRIDLLYHQAMCQLREGRFREVLRVGQQMLASPAQLDQPGPAYRAHSVAGLALTRQGQVDAAHEHYQTALAAAERSGNKLELAVVRENLGANHLRGGDFAAARGELAQAIALYRESVGEVRAVLALQLVCRVALAEGNLAEALSIIQQAEAIATDAGDRWRAECHQALGAIHGLRGEWAAAEDRFEHAIAIHRQGGHTVGLAESLVELGTIFERQDEWQRAEAAHQQAFELDRTLDASTLTIAVKRRLARAVFQRGATAAAHALVDEALGLARPLPRSIELAPTLLVAAELTYPQEPAGAMAIAREALGYPSPAAVVWEVHTFLAAATWAARELEVAASHARQALELAERSGSPWLIAESRRLAATVGGPVAEVARGTRRRRPTGAPH